MNIINIVSIKNKRWLGGKLMKEEKIATRQSFGEALEKLGDEVQ